MKTPLLLLIPALSGLPLAAHAEEYAARDPKNVSLRNEVGLSIDRGLHWLGTQQVPNGSWSLTELPALTGLVVTAYMREPSGRFLKERPEFLTKAYEYILRNQQPDGGIYQKGYFNYNTAICMMALLAAEEPSYGPALRKARNFLAGLQADSGDAGKIDNMYDGGIGYGNKDKDPDLSNTVMALEALRYTKNIESASEKEPVKKLNWDAAIAFIQRCQNLPENKDPWVSPEPEDRGGFFYRPSSTRGAELKLADGRTVFRSYGSMTYAGLLSYIYCDLKKDDPRVTAALDWLRANYTLDRNPGTAAEDGLEGLYYYYHMMAKALSTYDVNELELADGRKVDWRKDLAERLIQLQSGEGSWANQNGRWMEKDPVLVTSYAVLTLEMVYRGL